MRIAVASDGLDVADSFIQVKNFNFYTTEGFEVADSKNIPVRGIAHDQYAKLMETIGVDAIVCNSIAPTFKAAFERIGILVQTGAQGNALAAAQAFATQQAESLDNDLDD